MIKGEFSFVASDQSYQNLRRLIEVWRETAELFSVMGEVSTAELSMSAAYRDCAGDLEKIIGGDGSPVEKVCGN